MTDRELMRTLIENGFVTVNPNKFYREVKAVGLSKIVDMLGINNSANSVVRDYHEFEDSIQSYLREVRSLVVNDDDYNRVETDVLSEITRFIREAGNKYILSNMANEERLNIHENIISARQDLTNLNKDLADAEVELAHANNDRALLRKGLDELTKDTSIDNVERTERTFDIMDRIPDADRLVEEAQNRVNNIREIIAAQKSLIGDLETAYSNVKEVETPVIDKDFNDEFKEYINRINDAINNSSLSESTKKEVRRLSSNLISIESLPFINSDINNKRIDELCERFGLARTSGYKLPSAERQALPEANKIEEVKEELQDSYEAEIEEVIEEPEKASTATIAEEEKVEESIPVIIVPDEEKTPVKETNEEVKGQDSVPSIVPNEEKGIVDRLNEIFNPWPTAEPHEDTENKKEEEKVGSYEDFFTDVAQSVARVDLNEPKTNKESKKVIFTGKMGNMDVANTYMFSGLNVGEEYEVEYEDEINYHLKGFAFSFAKAAFAPVNEAVYSEEPIEKVVEPKSKFKVGDEIVLFDRPNLSDEEKELIGLLYLKNGIKKNTKYKVAEVKENGALKLEGFDKNFPDEFLMNGKDYDAMKERLLKGLASTNQKLVVYMGPTTGNLIHGEVYVEQMKIGNNALLRNVFGEDIKALHYDDKSIFKPYEAEKSLEVANDSKKKDGYSRRGIFGR